MRARLAFPKPEKRSATKRRRDRADVAEAQRVREKCVDRDGYCRLGFPISVEKLSVVGMCGGPSEWMHLGAKKRAHTRGMAPEERHTTSYSMMGCRGHHHAYDQGKLAILGLSAEMADGPLRFERNGRTYDEPERRRA